MSVTSSFFTNQKEKRRVLVRHCPHEFVHAPSRSFDLDPASQITHRSTTTVGCCVESFDSSSTTSFNECDSPQFEFERETRASSSAAARLIDLNWQSSRLRLSDRSSRSDIGSHESRMSNPSFTAPTQFLLLS